METETDVNEILYVWSSVKKEITRVSSLYPDGRLYLLEDPMQWILNNPTSLQLVRNLELNLGIFDDVEKLGKSLEQLPELSWLYIWSYVKYLPNTILSLQKLEYLEVRGFILLELPQNLGKLKSLKHLYICDSQCLKFLPDSITKLQNLVTLDLSYCRSLTKLPVNLGQLANLRHLSLLGCPLTSLPDSMAKLCSLESLDLSGCCAVKDYPRFLSRLFNLKSLSLCFCCFNSYNMPNPSKLESLHLCGKCDCITELPSCLDVGIKHLSFHDCGDIEFLPHSISKLSSLESLVLKGKFSDDPLTLPMNFDVLVSLKSLSLESYDKITSLPESLTKLSKLVSLKLNRYFELKDLPPNMDQLVGLRHLSLIGFCGIESFPDSLTKLSNLETLHLYGLSDCNIPLVELPAGFCQLIGLKHLSIGYCDIWSLPDSITNLSNLETLILKGCDNLTALPVSMGQLVNLRCLSLESCPIESFPDVAGLHNLESLELTCYSLRKLPEDLGELVKLVRLNISGSEIKCLPSSISKLHNLQSLILSDCFRLETLLPLNLNDSVVIIAIGCTKIRETTWGELKKEITPFSEQMVAEATTGESGLGFMNEQAIPDEALKVFDAASFPKACRSTLNHKIRDFGIKGKSIRKREHHKRNRKHSNVTPSPSSVRLNLIDPGLNWQSTRKRKRKERCNANA